MTETIITTNWHEHKQALREIRDLVFIQEQKVPVADEWDHKDEAATHFLVSTPDGKAIACARLLIEDDNFHIGRVAVLAEHRQQAVGRRLMQFVLAWCAQQNPAYKIYLHAQTSRIAFYEHLGFSPQGDVFMDAGIPHIEMWHRV
jgi:predicted GNAT family N-acyltransferase